MGQGETRPHIGRLWAGAMASRALGSGRGRGVIPGAVGEARSPAMDTGTALQLWLRQDRVVVSIALPFRGAVGVRGVGEVLVRVWEVELEECGGVVGERTGGEEGDVADDADGIRCGGRGEVGRDGGAGVRGGGGDCEGGEEGGEGEEVGVGEGTPVGEDVVEGGEGAGHGEGDAMEQLICIRDETRQYVNGTCPAFTMSTIRHVLPTAQRLPYFVRRNSRGSLPVYSDIRNGGTRYLIQIRDVDGRADVSTSTPSLCPPHPAQDLAQDLRQSLFDPHSPHAQRLAVRVQHQRHVILSGGRFKRDVLAWLTAKGF